MKHLDSDKINRITSEEAFTRISEIVKDLTIEYGATMSEQDIEALAVLKEDQDILNILLKAIRTRTWEDDETVPAMSLSLSLGDLEKIIQRKKRL